jgi:outer membrane protein OmpA-like peptidoglycan-associated protein
VAEDKDNFEDADGCPELDNDQDGILEPQDACPNEPETFNGEKDEDGCADAAATATLTETGVAITEQVLFATGKDEVALASYKLLDGVAAILKLHPEITRLRIEGHTDNKGAKAKNLALSERRAAAVLKYLTEKAGIDGARLVSQGFGPEFPVASNKSNEGRAQNRRVEFVLLEKNGVPVVLEARKAFEEPAPAPKPAPGAGKKPAPKPGTTEAPVPKRPKTEGEKPKPKPGTEDVPVPKRRR